MVLGLEITPFFCCCCCFFPSKEETDSLPVSLYILENQMLLKKKFPYPFLTPVQHYFWKNNLKIFSRWHSKWVSNIYTCPSKQIERGPKTSETHRGSSKRKRINWSLESQLTSDIKRLTFIGGDSMHYAYYALLILYAPNFFKFPFKISLPSNPQRSLLKRKLH